MTGRVQLESFFSQASTLLYCSREVKLFFEEFADVGEETLARFFLPLNKSLDNSIMLPSFVLQDTDPFREGLGV